MRSLFNLNNIMAALFLSQLLLSGCASVQTTGTTEGMPGAVERFRTFAVEYEKKGELRQALQRWEIVGSLRPEDAEVIKKISDLKLQINNSAEKHFKNGVANYKRNRSYEARKDFLLALSLNPEHKEALDYLKNRLAGEDVLQYQVKKGDTIKSIAQKNYRDADKAFLIAYFNNLGADARLSAGHDIKVPVLEPALMGKRVDASPPDEAPHKAADSKGAAGKAYDAKGAIGEAAAFYQSKEYLRTIAITEKILQSDPSRRDARDLLNAACYQKGRSLMMEEKYQGAVAMFECAEPAYKDVKNLAALSKKRLADSHYIRGVELFMLEKLDEAIEEWKVTLSFDPSHPKASSDIDNARALLNKVKEIR
jgi:tetratricopeptide (TPR) repeat protein